VSSGKVRSRSPAPRIAAVQPHRRGLHAVCPIGAKTVRALHLPELVVASIHLRPRISEPIDWRICGPFTGAIPDRTRSASARRSDGFMLNRATRTVAGWSGVALPGRQDTARRTRVAPWDTLGSRFRVGGVAALRKTIASMEHAYRDAGIPPSVPARGDLVPCCSAPSVEQGRLGSCDPGRIERVGRGGSPVLRGVREGTS